MQTVFNTTMNTYQEMWHYIKLVPWKQDIKLPSGHEYAKL